VPDILVYQTSDPRFADQAIEALTRADISCFQTGRGFVDIRPGIRQDLGNGICIYIRDKAKYREANEILISLGAVVEAPLRLPSGRWVFLIVLAIAVVVILAIAAGN
jgi:hypothetical protein